jgi:YHS domain-containing protein
MEGMLSFLLFAGVFYLMMRFGCGTHMLHGGHDHREKHNQPIDKHVVDPVCGKQLEAEQGYGKIHDGTLYRFCSRDCLDAFEAAPDKYMNKYSKGDA